MVAKVKKLRIISELTHFFEETTKVENKSKDPDIKIRNAGRGGGRLLGHGSPVFDRSVNPISTVRGGVDCAHPPHGFLDLSTALRIIPPKLG